MVKFSYQSYHLSIAAPICVLQSVCAGSSKTNVGLEPNPLGNWPASGVDIRLDSYGGSLTLPPGATAGTYPGTYDGATKYIPNHHQCFSCSDNLFG